MNGEGKEEDRERQRKVEGLKREKEELKGLPLHCTKKLIFIIMNSEPLNKKIM